MTVDASVVVNATGVWADELRMLEDGTTAETIRPAKGVHVTLPWSLLRNEIAAVIPVPDDRRSLFVIPWGPRPDGTYTHTYIGTTDTDYVGDLDDPPCTAADIDYVLGAVNAAIGAGLSRADVTGVWAGLRPLVRSASSGRTADLSRRHRVTTGPGGVVAVTGGKLTSYRAMAEDTVDAVAAALGHEANCRTRRLLLLGAEGFTEAVPGSRAAHLGNRFGTLAPALDDLLAVDAALAEPLVPGLPYLRAEAVYAARHEMVTTLSDVLTRRTRAHLFDRAATLAAAPDVAALIGPELGWDATTRRATGRRVHRARHAGRGVCGGAGRESRRRASNVPDAADRAHRHGVPLAFRRHRLGVVHGGAGHHRSRGDRRDDARRVLA